MRKTDPIESAKASKKGAASTGSSPVKDSVFARPCAALSASAPACAGSAAAAAWNAGSAAAAR